MKFKVKTKEQDAWIRSIFCYWEQTTEWCSFYVGSEAERHAEE